MDNTSIQNLKGFLAWTFFYSCGFYAFHDCHQYLTCKTQIFNIISCDVFINSGGTLVIVKAGSLWSSLLITQSLLLSLKASFVVCFHHVAISFTKKIQA
jgi:hypothetical protein